VKWNNEVNGLQTSIRPIRGYGSASGNLSLFGEIECDNLWQYRP